MTYRHWVMLFGVLALVSLVPVVWAIVDVARRPPWQFTTGRKLLWGISLGLGWVVLWPVALVSSIVYLTVLRRRFPQSSAPPPGTPYPPYGQYGQGPYGQGPYGGGPYGRPYGSPPQPPPEPQLQPEQLRPEQLPPAGWYPDPAGSPSERWWDGRGWTEHLR